MAKWNSLWPSETCGYMNWYIIFKDYYICQCSLKMVPLSRPAVDFRSSDVGCRLGHLAKRCRAWGGCWNQSIPIFPWNKWFIQLFMSCYCVWCLYYHDEIVGNSGIIAIYKINSYNVILPGGSVPALSTHMYKIPFGSPWFGTVSKHGHGKSMEVPISTRT